MMTRIVVSCFNMQSDWDNGLGGLEAQLTSKAREWLELLVARVHQLESLLKQAQGESSSLRYHVYVHLTSE